MEDLLSMLASGPLPRPSLSHGNAHPASPSTYSVVVPKILVHNVPEGLSDTLRITVHIKAATIRDELDVM